MPAKSPDYRRKTVYLKDVKASGIAGGASTSGAYQTRVLNTLEGDTSFVSLVSNQFTLQPGTYHIEASAPSNASNQHRIKIRNITDSTDSIIGSSSTNGNSSSPFTVTSHSFLCGIISITSAKTFELQHRVGTSRAPDGYGPGLPFGDADVYSQVKITKVR